MMSMRIIWTIVVVLLSVPLTILAVLLLDEVGYRIGRRLGAPTIFRTATVIAAAAFAVYLMASRISELTE